MLKKFKKSLVAFFYKSNDYPARTVAFNGEDFCLRGLEVDDIKGLLDLEREIYQGELPWTKSAFLSEFRSHIPHLYLGLFAEDVVIAFIGCRQIGKDTHITNFAVKPKFQKRGIGTFLVTEMERFANKNHSSTMSLEVRVSNKDAQRLYRQLGFVSRTIKPQYYNETNEDAVDMLKYL